MVTARDIDAVESVQRRFTKRLPTLKHLPHHERLKCLDISSLELWRLHIDLFWCYKIVFGLMYVDLDDLFVFAARCYAIAAYAVMRCPSVCVSVRPSVTFVDSVETNTIRYDTIVCI